MQDPGTVTFADFEKAEGQAFTLPEGERLVLVQVKRLQSPSPRPDPFSALFAHAELRLTQGCYRLSNDTLGDIELFLVPLQPDTRGRLFEAVFN